MLEWNSWKAERQPRLPHDGDEASPPRVRVVQGLIEARVLALASGVGAQPTALRRLEGGAGGPPADPVND